MLDDITQAMDPPKRPKPEPTITRPVNVSLTKSEWDYLLTLSITSDQAITSFAKMAIATERMLRPNWKEQRQRTKEIFIESMDTTPKKYGSFSRLGFFRPKP